MGEGRSWSLLAGHPSDIGYLVVDSSLEAMRMSGVLDPVAVVAHEDPDGPYWGWLRHAYLHYPADPTVTMVQPNRGLFAMQFPYGPEREADAGHGEVVRLRIEAVEST